VPGPLTLEKSALVALEREGVVHGADALCEPTAMDYEACNVVYVDRAAPEDKLVKRQDLISSAFTPNPLSQAEEDVLVSGRTALNDNLQTLLGMFNEGLSQPSSS
jgi:hypothetical protein